jgi:hypothetical protein
MSSRAAKVKSARFPITLRNPGSAPRTSSGRFCQ